MEVEENQDGRRFPVVCVWCGAEICRGDMPRSEGMCQHCFRRMIEEHTRTAARQYDRAYASER
jgi:NMD protein affecting ribosome stability and mRNA decay